MTVIPKEELDVFLSLKDIKIVFDVGSRDDSEMFKLRPEYEYHLFEPNPAFADKIEGAENVTVNYWGLGDVEETKVYFPRTQSFVCLEWDCVNEGLSFPIKTLDSYSVQPDFLKIDTEGYDYKVLLGGKEKLKKVKYVQFEYWDGVKKFADLLTEFDLFLMLEPKLRDIALSLSHDDRYKQTLVPLDVDFVDNKLIRNGAGGNVLGIRK